MENLNKAVNDVQELLLHNMDENQHLKEIIKNHEITINQLKMQIEDLLSRPPTPPLEKKKIFGLW